MCSNKIWKLHDFQLLGFIFCGGKGFQGKFGKVSFAKISVSILGVMEMHK